MSTRRSSHARFQQLLIAASPVAMTDCACLVAREAQSPRGLALRFEFAMARRVR